MKNQDKIYRMMTQKRQVLNLLFSLIFLKTKILAIFVDNIKLKVLK